jgi:hypothetical protein
MTKKKNKKTYVVQMIKEGKDYGEDFVEAHSPESAFEEYKKDFGIDYETYQDTVFVVCELKPVLKYNQTVGWEKENV